MVAALLAPGGDDCRTERAASVHRAFRGGGRGPHAGVQLCVLGDPPEHLTFAFALGDDYSFGILQSAPHIVWFRERCSRLKADPRYTSKTVFDTFPWPQAPSQRAVDRVVDVVAELLAFRAERMAQGITIGQQYDSLRQPGRSRLRDLHDALDRAVLDVYGFDPNEDLLAQILALNLSLAEQEQVGGAVRGPGPQGLANTTRSTWRIEPVHRLV